MHDVQLVALSHDLQILASLDSFEIMKMLLAMRLTQQNKCREVRVSMDDMAWHHAFSNLDAYIQMQVCLHLYLQTLVAYLVAADTREALF